MSTINAVSCSRDDVQAAFAAATAFSLTSAEPILVKWPAAPTGGLAWKEPILWNAPPNVTLMGAGKDKTIILDEYANPNQLLQIVTNAQGYFNWFHMSFKGGNIGSESNAKYAGMIGISGQCKKFWAEEVPIDAMSYTPLVPTAAIRFTGHVTGVFVPGNVRNHSTGNGIQVWYNGYGGASDVGDAAWAAPTGFGGPDFLFIEDSTFDTNSVYGSATDSLQGGKYVFRNNVVNGVMVQTHSTSSGNGRGARATEVYRNKFKCSDPRSAHCVAWIDSGPALVWGNDAEGYVHFQTQHARRRSDDGHGQNVTPAGYGYCGPSPQSGVVSVSGSKVTWVSGAKFNTAWPKGTMMFIGLNPDSNGWIIGSVQSDTELTLAPGGTNPALPGTLTSAVYSMGSHLDGNQDPITGYPMMDMVGRGKGDLLKGWFPNMINEATGADLTKPGAWPRQAPEPMYQFANNHVPVPNSNGVIFEGADIYKEGRDYHLQKQNFDGTSGVGVGLLAARPATCVPGVGYWATDREELYVCKTANVWEFYYRPHPYPHPLRAGGVPLPDSGPIVVPPIVVPPIVVPPIVTPPVDPPTPQPPNWPPTVRFVKPTGTGAMYELIVEGKLISTKWQYIKLEADDDLGPVTLEIWIDNSLLARNSNGEKTLTAKWNTNPHKNRDPLITGKVKDAGEKTAEVAARVKVRH